MAGFPIAWDYEAASADGKHGDCPYSPNEMKEYLHKCHYHYATDEEPLQLGEPCYLAEFDTLQRHFWMWSLRDQFGREWNLMIGHGRSPFVDDDRHCHRWIYADEATEEDTTTFMKRQAANHPD